MKLNNVDFDTYFKKYPDEKESCFTYLSDRLSHITGEKPEKLYESFLKSGNPSVRLVRNTGSEKRGELEAFFKIPYDITSDKSLDLRDCFHFNICSKNFCGFIFSFNLKHSVPSFLQINIQWTILGEGLEPPRISPLFLSQVRLPISPSRDCLIIIPYFNAKIKSIFRNT